MRHTTPNGPCGADDTAPFAAVVAATKGFDNASPSADARGDGSPLRVGPVRVCHRARTASLGAVRAVTYATDLRLAYIDWRLLTVGSIQRGDLKRQFGVSEAQASVDLREFERAHPGAMRYEKSGHVRAYVPARREYQSVRGMTPAVIEAIAALAKAKHPMGWRV